MKLKLVTKHIPPINRTAYVTIPDTLVSIKLDLCDIHMVKIIVFGAEKKHKITIKFKKFHFSLS